MRRDRRAVGGEPIIQKVIRIVDVPPQARARAMPRQIHATNDEAASREQFCGEAHGREARVRAEAMEDLEAVLAAVSAWC